MNGTETRSIERARAARRGFVFGLAGSALLAACGGGGGDEDGPSIAEFQSDRTSAFVGESVRLTARFANGAGRIEPGVGPVASGQPVQTPPLMADTTFRLVVVGGARQVSRELALPVGYRNRYRTLAQPFVSGGHTALLLADGSVLAIGGSRGENTLSSNITRYDAATESFTTIGQLGTGRQFHSATLLADGRVLVLGGTVSLNGFRAGELVDPRDGSARPSGAFNHPRQGHSATLLADGRVFVAGGWTAGGSIGLLASAEIWDPASGQFRLLAAEMSNARAGHSATALADGTVLIAGGHSWDARYHWAERFDPVTETFTVVQSADQEPRALHAAHRLADGSVLLLGGEDNMHSAASPTVLRYDPLQRTIERARPLAAPRGEVSSVLAADGRVLMFGGLNDGLFPTASAEAYGSADGGTPLPPMPQARSGHSVTRLADGRVLILGGWDNRYADVASAMLFE
ncbi:MAG: hypothetical protein KIT17_05295 [Rubrivivax sp.]|nr:hypothetical protein [Rubrivivax sp.]